MNVWLAKRVSPRAPAILALLSIAPGLLVLAYYVWCYVGRSWSIVTFPYAWDYGETPELARSLAIAHGEPIYTFWDQPPYRMANYTPLFAAVNSLFVLAFGPQYQSGRAIAWVCSLLFCGGLAWLAWRESRGLLAPAVTALLWFSSHYVWNWTPLNREDELAMLFSLAGMIVFYEGVVRKRDLTLGIRLSLVFFLLAIYTRQTTVEATIACGLILLFSQPRRGLAFFAAFGALGALIFGLLDAATGGAFFLNVVTGNINLFSWGRVGFLASQFWQTYQAAALLAIAYCVLQLGQRRQPLFILWLVATFAVAITGGKDGAAENYELLPWGAISLAAGLGVAQLNEIAGRLWRRRLPAASALLALGIPVITGLLVLLQAQLAFHVPYEGQWSPATFERFSSSGVNLFLRRWTESGWYRGILPWAPPPRALETRSGFLYRPSAGQSDREEQALLDARVAAAPGDVLDEDMSHLLLAGKRIYIQPFEFGQEARLDQWDQTPLLLAISKRQFSLVITTNPLSRARSLTVDRFTPQIMAVLNANYCLAEQTARYFVYQPCGKTISRINPSGGR